MKGFYDIIINDNLNIVEKIIRSHVSSMKYYNIRTYIEPNNIKILCNDYRAKQYLVCNITNDEIVFGSKFKNLIKVLREIKINSIID